MKTKPVSHKLDNTFKFESFNTRLSKINVSLLHNIKRGVNGLQSDQSITFFAITLEKWFDLNASQDFRDLCKSIGNLLSVQSLPQIIHRKQELIDILVNNLKRKDNLAVDVVLELVISLARDLNTDFYPHFAEIFVCLSDLLNSTNSETIENTFICLTFLFKYLSKYIIKEFNKNFGLFSTLLISKKDYIRKFTSESLSFVIRKAENKTSILDKLFKSVSKEPKLIEGIGYLLFESVKGVNNDLHSCAENFLHLLFDRYLCLENENLDKTIGLMFEHLFQYISKQNSGLIWKTLLIDSNSESIQLKKVISILKSAIGYKKCCLVESPSKLVNSFIDYLKTNRLDETDRNNILISFNYLSFNCFQYITEEDIKSVNQTLYSSDYLPLKQILDFTKSIFNCLPFERMFLPSILKFCSKYLKQDCEDQCQSNQQLLIVKFLTELVLSKRLRPFFGSDIRTINKYILNFEKDICKPFLNLIANSNDLKIIWSAFVCLPNLVPISDEKTIISVITETLLKLKSNNCGDRWFGYIVVEFVISLIILKNGKPFDELDPKFFIDLLNDNQTNTEILNAFDLYLSYRKEFNENNLDPNILDMIYKSLEINFSSFCRTNRLLSLHILTLFDPPLPPSEDITTKTNSIFSICLNAESIAVDLSQYRLKLKHLQSLDHSMIKHSVPLSTSGGLQFDQMPIHYLFGALYENLTLLWTPIVKLIESYAKGLGDKKAFLKIFFNHFNETTDKIINNYTFDSNYYQKDVKTYLDSEFYFSNTKSSQTSERPDFGNHRLLLLKAMEFFVEVIEPSNREFVSMFFDFIDNEMSYHLIVGQNSKEDIVDTDQTEEDTAMEVDTVVERKPGLSQKTLWKTLFSYMKVLSKFKNPKALYRNKELLDFHLNLLSCADSEAQKNAFNCVLPYYESFLSDFQQNFLRLIDEKSFKSEIYSFILNSGDSEQINLLESDNRPNIVPILMRILYGKLMSSNGTKTHGKNSGDFRRSIILKVLSAFKQNELILFMDFVFSPIIQFVQNDYQTLNQNIKSTIDLKSMIPLRRLQALIRTLHFVLKYLGNNSQTITSYIFKVLVVVSNLVSTLLATENRNKINEQSISRLKDIRSNCFKVAISFFDTFDAYNYSSDEIDGLFESLIRPLLVNLDTESLSAVSPLLSFLICLSQNSRYFKMFAKSDPLVPNMTPIDVIIKLYDNPKVQTPVINTVTELINNLLILDEFDESNEQKLSEIQINCLDSRFTSNTIEEPISFGTNLLLPFTSQVLNRIRLNFENNKKNKQKKKKNFGFSEQELNILSHLTPYVTKSDESLTLSLLLIHSINTKRTEEQKELQTIRSLSHLAKNIGSDVTQVLNSLIPLFGKISNCNSRSELCKTLQVLSQNDSQLLQFSQIITNINAFNPRFPEEPDYPKRIEAFKTINSELQSDICIRYDFFALILQNCIHFIKTCNDLAIRESASNTIKNVLKKLEQMNDNNLFNTFAINLLLYSTISKGLRTESEVVRHEWIELILALIEINGQRHPILQQLALLCNKEDEEIDFWLNIKHIQIHRRSRALTRLAKNESLLKQLSCRVFSDFLIHLTTNFLNDIQYAKQTSIVNASIEAIGSFAKRIQWSKYYFILRFYINRLIAQKTDQKINIKIISAILDNFPFIESNEPMITEDINENNELTDEEEEEAEEDIAEEEQNENQITSDKIELDSNKTKAMDKIYNSTLNHLLPLLQKVLHQKSGIDFAYDSMKSEYSEDDDIQRVSIGLAIIKLLKSIKSSDEVLKTNASSVFLRLCQFLQSRAQSIRDSARNTFIKVMQCLGPKCLKYALNQMKAILSKGYQRHVFVYTVHAILAELRPQLQNGDLDNCLDSLIEICCLELFGSLSEEKEVSQITSKLKEAKKSKSFDIFEIMAAFVSQKCLNQLLNPLKTTLLEAHTHKVVRKISQSLIKIGQGLISNSSLDEQTLLNFLFETINDIISDSQKKDINSDNNEKARVKRPDSFIINKPIYQRSGKQTKIGETSNNHVLIEFGLNCFVALTKQNRLQSSNESHGTLLDPFIVLFEALLESKDPKLTTLSLQCLHYLYTKFPGLPSFAKHSQNVMKTIFVLLHKYAKFGYNDREDSNVQMVVLCFKTLSLFIEKRTDVTLNEEQMTVLLSYIEQDLSNDLCQTTVFVILKSILSRKYNSSTFQRIMKKVSEIAILSQNDSIRNNCSQLSIKYLTEYSPNNLKKRITFFIKNLEHKTSTGRESAINVVKNVITCVEYEFLHKNIAIFFVPLSSRLINESSSECKKSVADSIIKLLKRIDESDRNMLFNDLITVWLQSNTTLQKLLASHLCSLYLTVENKDFFKRLPNILPLLKQQLDATRYQNNEAEDESKAKTKDSLVYQHLNLFIRLMKTDPNFIKKNQFLDDINDILESISSFHVLHPHLWIRVICTQIFGQLFSEYSTECLAKSIGTPVKSNEFLLIETKDKLKQMASKFCLIFRDIYNTEVLSDQLIKNLVYISRVFIQSSNDKTDNLDFKWILNKLIFEVKYELKVSPNLTKKRFCIFKWMAAVAVELGTDRLEDYIFNFLPLLCREETNSENIGEDNELVVLSKQVLQLFKSIVGTEKFSEYYAKTRTQIISKKIERKKNIAIQSVNEVVRSAKRKISKHNRSNESKKRKISNYKQKLNKI